MTVRRKHIQTLADQLRGDHGISSAPVPIEALAHALGADVRKSPAEDPLSGFLLRDPNSRRAVIGVNSKHHPNRQRFTLAHELGHFLLHQGERVHVDRSDQAFLLKLRSDEASTGTDVEEIEANLFAAEILMPAALLKADLADNDALDVLDETAMEKVLKALAKKYLVSTQALTYRLINLGLIQG